jgi:hypothetical protein
MPGLDQNTTSVIQNPSRPLLPPSCWHDTELTFSTAAVKLVARPANHRLFSLSLSFFFDRALAFSRFWTIYFMG